MASLCPELSPFSSLPLSVSKQPSLHSPSCFFRSRSLLLKHQVWTHHAMPSHICKHILFRTAVFYSQHTTYKEHIQNKRLLTHPDCDSVVRHYFQVRQRGGTLGHSVQLIYGCPQPSSVHVMQCEGNTVQNKNRTGQCTTLLLKDPVSGAKRERER